jgi:hypothetical protein
MLKNQTRLSRKLFKKAKTKVRSKGYLILDDTIIDKRNFKKYTQWLSWVWSPSDGRYLLGICVVLLIWTDGHIRIPLAVRIWKKGSHKSKIDHAIDLLNDAKYRYQLNPDAVIFDSWYGAAKVLHHIQALGWHWVTKLKSNRVVLDNGLSKGQLKNYWKNYYNSAHLHFNGGIEAFVAKHGKQFFATSLKYLSVDALKKLYKIRQAIEEVFKVLKTNLHLEHCASRDFHSQKTHIYLCLFAFILMENTVHKHNISSIDALQTTLSNLKIPAPNPYNLEVLHVA